MWPFDDILNAINGLFLFFIALIMLIAYGPVRLFEVCYNALVSQINLVIELLNAFIGIYNVIVDGIFGLVPGVTLYTVLLGSSFVSITLNFYHCMTSPAVPGVK